MIKQLTKLFVIWGKLQRKHQTESGHFAPAYLGLGKNLKATLEVSLWGKFIVLSSNS